MTRITLEQAKDLLPPDKFEEVKKSLSNSRLKSVNNAQKAKNNPAEDLLWDIWQEEALLNGIKPAREHSPIPGRKYRLDMAIPDIKAGAEADGWQYHAKHKDAWLKEKLRDRVFLLSGWRVLRFTASEILYKTEDVRKDIRRLIALCRGDAK